VGQALDRYDALLAGGRCALRGRFDTGELALLADADNGTLCEAWSIPCLRGDVADAIALDGLAAMWGVDGAALLVKLAALTPVEAHALVAAIEAFRETVVGGEGQATGRAFRSIFLALSLLTFLGRGDENELRRAGEEAGQLL